MHKKLISLGVGIALLASPLLASAQTTTSSNASIIASLEALVATLTQELQQLIAAKSSSLAPEPITASWSSPQPAASGMTSDVALVCNASVTLKRGDTDATTNGEVSRLQEMLGISPTTGYYGAQTSIGFQNICGGLGNTQPTSVAGMSEYTDSNFGFSFWYPSGWAVATVPSASQNGLKLVDSSGNLKMFIDEEPVTNGSIPSEYCNAGAFGENYYFDQNSGSWMDSGKNFDGTTFSGPADVSHNTMGGLHMFTFFCSNPQDVAIPLSASKYVEVHGGSNDVQLANTILATNPAVAIPVSTSQQFATIEAEAQSYALPGGGLLASPGANNSTFSASPTSGSSPLTVTFSANYGVASYVGSTPITECPSDIGYMIDYGDGSQPQGVDCLGHLVANADGSVVPAPPAATHTYANSGTYTARFEQGGGLNNSSYNTISTVIVTVTQ